MKLITQEWINTAEGDFATAQRELQIQQMPNYDAVCFHSQQCIEKYLMPLSFAIRVHQQIKL